MADNADAHVFIECVYGVVRLQYATPMTFLTNKQLNVLPAAFFQLYFVAFAVIISCE